MINDLIGIIGNVFYLLDFKQILDIFLCLVLVMFFIFMSDVVRQEIREKWRGNKKRN